MKIEHMRPQDQIAIQDAKILKGNYSIHWMPHVYFSDLLVCLKSSWLSYDEWIKILEDHCDETKYPGEKVYWEKVTNKSELQIPLITIKPPIDVVLLPVTGDEIFIPKDQDECTKLQKTIKGSITYIQRRVSFVLLDLITFKRTEEFQFLNEEISLETKEDEVVAEYSIGDLRYPVTSEMLGRKMVVRIPRRYACQPSVAKDMNAKYNLKISEE